MKNRSILNMLVQRIREMIGLVQSSTDFIGGTDKKFENIFINQ